MTYIDIYIYMYMLKLVKNYICIKLYMYIFNLQNG